MGFFCIIRNRLQDVLSYDATKHGQFKAWCWIYLEACREEVGRTAQPRLLWKLGGTFEPFVTGTVLVSALGGF